MLGERNLVVTARRNLTEDICEFELRRPDGGVLAPFRAGAHIKVQTPSGDVRSYSLTNDELDRDRYTIAVKHERAGRGGSASMHQAAVKGTLISATEPANEIEIVNGDRHLLIAGGVGITPMISIFRKLSREHHPDFHLVYLSRAPEHAAYLEELLEVPSDRLTVHHSAVRGRRFNLWPLVATPANTHLYYCGPSALMETLRLLTIHWPRSQLHFEDFSGVSAIDVNSAPFKVRRVSTGEVFDVPADRTILEVLRANGLHPRSSCETGTCGTCQVRLITGDADHRDMVLTEDDRFQFFMPCVSRAHGGEIVLDI
ncbi:PDR/VanB family oxidoreductase [Rhizobium mesosinicum]|uniref:Oxidoreductase n=1 Tax=Rhizobium mesosinicum TaxID=335017 RepID=A0ABS7GLZ1_9HYPH|nr:PDR/VanB family oxidoreductase [Rhizobium mesosinicum]MBW9051014.1 oxidoreductase [Rhizobium mesosinicum]